MTWRAEHRCNTYLLVPAFADAEHPTSDGAGRVRSSHYVFMEVQNSPRLTWAFCLRRVNRAGESQVPLMPAHEPLHRPVLQRSGRVDRKTQLFLDSAGKIAVRPGI